jgi:hypothetical protein
MKTWNWWSTDSKVGWRSENKKGKSRMQMYRRESTGNIKGRIKFRAGRGERKRKKLGRKKSKRRKRRRKRNCGRHEKKLSSSRRRKK